MSTIFGNKQSRKEEKATEPEPEEEGPGDTLEFVHQVKQKQQADYDETLSVFVW